jgi:hypothetical protein
VATAALWDRCEKESQLSKSKKYSNLDPAARNKINTNIIESDDRQTWTIEQTLVDPEELNDFQLIFSLSITDAKENSTVKIVPLKLKSIAE